MVLVHDIGAGRENQGGLKVDGPKEVTSSPPKCQMKAVSKKKIPVSPNASLAASRKLKSFHTKTSPKKNQNQSSGAPIGKRAPVNSSIPHTEENTHSKKNKETKTTKCKVGQEESRISPELPA